VEKFEPRRLAIEVMPGVEAVYPQMTAIEVDDGEVVSG
jgi:hypothetical protein